MVEEKPFRLDRLYCVNCNATKQHRIESKKRRCLGCGNWTIVKA